MFTWLFFLGYFAPFLCVSIGTSTFVVLNVRSTGVLLEEGGLLS
jgi:hypothetical protein